MKKGLASLRGAGYKPRLGRLAIQDVRQLLMTMVMTLCMGSVISFFTAPE